MGLSWQQGPLSSGAIGRFLVREPLPNRLLYVEPLRRRMRVRFGGKWIADSEHVHKVGEIRHKSPIDAWDGGFAPGLDPARRDAGQALRRCPRLLGSRLQSRCSAAPARSRWPFGLSMHGSFNSDDTTGTNR